MKSVGMGYNRKVNADDLKAENEALKAEISKLKMELEAASLKSKK